MGISPLLFQEEQLSVNGKRMHFKYWCTACGRLAHEQCGWDNCMTILVNGGTNQTMFYLKFLWSGHEKMSLLTKLIS